jgi:hypothetical protein
MNQRVPIITNGFSNDQNTPSDMFRYRTRKSFPIKFRIRKKQSPLHSDAAGTDRASDGVALADKVELS